MRLLHNMELAWIEDFIALNETRNFTAAADRRHSTQPAFSRRIQNLEYWLGVVLFNREDRPVTLTAAGREFEKRAYRLREDMMDARRISNLAATNLPDAVTIYTTNTIAVGMLPQWIAQNKIKSYRLVVSSVSACLEAVRHQRCEYALVPSFAGLDDDLPGNAVKIASDSLVFAAAGTRRASLENGVLVGDILMYSPKTAFGRVIEAEMAKRRIMLDRPPICESASAEALMAQVRAGLGEGWVISSLVGEHDKITVSEDIFNVLFDIMLLESYS